MSTSITSEEKALGRNSIETMEMVTMANKAEYEELMNQSKTKDKLNISRNSPKLFVFGAISDATAEQINVDDDLENEFVFCVFRVIVGNSYCHKL